VLGDDRVGVGPERQLSARIRDLEKEVRGRGWVGSRRRRRRRTMKNDGGGQAADDAYRLSSGTSQG
jgi:hypothetical protein